MPINIHHEFLEHKLYLRRDIPTERTTKLTKNVNQTPSPAGPPNSQLSYDVVLHISPFSIALKTMSIYTLSVCNGLCQSTNS